VQRIGSKNYLRTSAKNCRTWRREGQVDWKPKIRVTPIIEIKRSRRWKTETTIRNWEIGITQNLTRERWERGNWKIEKRIRKEEWAIVTKEERRSWKVKIESTERIKRIIGIKRLPIEKGKRNWSS